MPILEKLQVIMGTNDSFDGFQKKATLNELDTVHELLNTILDHLPLGVFVKDPENHYNYLYWNRFMEEITGIDTSQIEGHDDSEVHYNALMSIEERLEVDKNVISSGKVAEFHGWLKTVSGDTKYIEVAKYPISLSNGKPLLLALWSDATVKRAIEKRLESERDKAELADKLKSKYLADMSHEIRTPLNAITGFSEMMAFADTDEERMSYYEIIKANNQLLMQLINDILDLSKIEADAIKISYAPIDLNEMMDTTYASIKPRMPKDVKLILEKGLDRCTFGADYVRLLQLINNLVNNAIKNTKKGSITMGYKSLGDGKLNFYVKDTGQGIAEAQLQNLFNRFVKVNDYVEGIGLGLAICKGLVTKMGGTIQVESKLGEGSTFSFILPSHAW